MTLNFRKLGSFEFRDTTVRIFTPPHDQPDFPWVAIHDLAKAFFMGKEADHIAALLCTFEGGLCAVDVQDKGEEIKIVPHFVAQGVCDIADIRNGYQPNDDEDGGPLRWAYAIKFGKFAADNWPLDFADIFAAFKGQGGVFAPDDAPA